MANRYWVGSNGNWSSASHWSASSGGAGGASVPTSSDAVIFNGNSGTGLAQLTGPGFCASFDCSAYTGSLKLSGATLHCAGSLILGSGMTVTAPSTTIVLEATSAATIDLAGKALSGVIRIIIGGSGGSYQLLNDINVGAGCAVDIRNGGLDLNGFNLTAQSLTTNNTGHGTRSLSLGSGIVSLGNFFDNTDPANFTFNAGTSTIRITNPSSFLAKHFDGGGQTYYDVEVSSGGTMTVNGTNIFNNLTFSAASTFKFSGDQTINGSFSADAGSGRMSVSSTSSGTARVITAASIGTLSNIDFSDIDAEGASVPWSGTGLVDNGGNINITF